MLYTGHRNGVGSFEVWPQAGLPRWQELGTRQQGWELSEISTSIAKIAKNTGILHTTQRMCAARHSSHIAPIQERQRCDEN